MQFQIRFSENSVHDLRHRLANTRFAPDLNNDDWHYGVPTEALRHWVAAWQRFDFTRVLTTFSIYWLTESLWSSVRMYRHGADNL
ncbi:MAG: epoxide hydrolase N-terminal domain-containing protein [Spongiibacteraceae bacterium]